MASNTESDLEDKVEDVTEEVGRDVIIVESVNAKGKRRRVQYGFTLKRWRNAWKGLDLTAWPIVRRAEKVLKL